MIPIAWLNFLSSSVILLFTCDRWEYISVGCLLLSMHMICVVTAFHLDNCLLCATNAA